MTILEETVQSVSLQTQTQRFQRMELMKQYVLVSNLEALHLQVLQVSGKAKASFSQLGSIRFTKLNAS